MELLYTIGVTLVALGLLVTIHEWGHFWVARLCGVKVLRFSVGFGRSLFTWTDKQQTEYTLAVLPLGGYVKMLDERNGPVADEEKHLAFNTQRLAKRVAIVSAGPVANFLLAIGLFYTLFLGGVTEHRAVISHIQAGSPAALAGMRTGEEVLAINGIDVHSREDLMRYIIDLYGENSATVALVTQDNQYDMYLTWMSQDDQSPLDLLGLEFYIPKLTSKLTKVLRSSPAAGAGLQVGDRLLKANGEAVIAWDGWLEVFRSNPDKVIDLEFERDGMNSRVKLTPKAVKSRGQMIGQVGVVPEIQTWPQDMLLKKEYSLLSAWVPAVAEVWDKSILTLGMIKKMVVGQISVKEVGGPIAIAKQASMSSKLGWRSYISLIALLSISLGVLNLLPIPVLDGGHLVFYLIEGVRGKPLSETSQMLAFQVGGMLVFSFMMFAIYNDIARV